MIIDAESSDSDDSYKVKPKLPHERNQQLRKMIPDKVKDIIIFPDEHLTTNEVVLPHLILLPKTQKAKPKVDSEVLKDRPKIERITSKNPIDYHALINEYQISCLNQEILVSPSTFIEKTSLTREQNKKMTA